MASYLRNFTLEITPGRTEDGTFVPSVTEPHVLSELRIVFNIRNTLLGDPALASFQLYNIARTTRAMLASEACKVEAKFGYTGEDENTIFTGTVTNTYEMRQGPDVIQQVWVRDSWEGLDIYKPDVSRLEDISVGDAIRLITANAPGVSAPNYYGNAESVVNSAEDLDSYVSVGNLAEELTDLLDPLDLQWNVRFGELRIINKNEALVETTPEIIVPVKRETGLLGVPTIGYTGVSFSHLLNPRFQPDTIVKVDPNTVRYELGNEFYVEQDYDKWNATGLFRIMEVTHRGDTRGNKWHSDVRCFYKGENTEA